MLVLSVILVVGYGIDVVMIIFCCGCCKLLAHSEKKNSSLLLSYLMGGYLILQGDMS